MAFNVQTFRTRALTAIIFAAVMLLGLLWNQWSFLVLFSIIHFGCWWEYFNLLEKIHNTALNPYLRQGFMMVGYGLMLFFCGDGYQVSGYALKTTLALPVSAAGFAMLVIGIFQKEAIHLKAMGASALGWIYISLAWGLMAWLYSHPVTIHVHDNTYEFTGQFIPLLIIASIWINDTMAYIVGSFIGKTPLSPVSPKKTWEGTVGGVILSVVVVGLLASFIKIEGQGWPLGMIAGAIALVAAITGTMGDLLESKLKRMADVKDSGNFMPGHGGFLDRFDSLLLATTSVTALVKIFMIWG